MLTTYNIIAKPITSLDIFRRTCIKKPTLESILEDDEIELLEATSTEASVEEEGQPSFEEEPIDIKAIHAELECLKRRIQKLQLILKEKAMKECLDDVCVDDVLLTCTDNNEICALQKANHQMQSKINEIVQSLKCAKETIQDLRTSLCAKTSEINELQKNIAQLQYWRKNLHHEFGVCVERFEYLKHVKAEWAQLRPLFRAVRLREDQFVSKRYFNKLAGALKREIVKLRNIIKKISSWFVMRIQEVKITLKKVPGDIQDT